MAMPIADNAKTQRYSPCNTMETLLVARGRSAGGAAAARPHLPGRRRSSCAATPATCSLLADHGIGCMPPEEDWRTEYLAPILAIRIVDGIDEAIAHINDLRLEPHRRHRHRATTADAMRFLREVDSASVMVNASTRFADGFEFGLGAEIGISTDKLHARGPVGLEGLTSQKFVVFGSGQIR